MDWKYKTLQQILDKIREEAVGTDWQKRYSVTPDEEFSVENISHSRSLAYIHLVLKTRFGLEQFKERESFVTDGPNDGGIDGYFIDTASKVIFLIQSKFRTTSDNFQSKKIKSEEILKMDADRITRGENANSLGVRYNGKIQKLIKKISETPDIARYSYKVLVIANTSLNEDQLNKITGGFATEVIDHNRCYTTLILPTIKGTYSNAAEIQVSIDLSNKSSGSKAGYSSETPHHQVDVTILFVPAIEIARLMATYRNSVLLHNPRSYLSLDGKKVNQSIEHTLTNGETSELAILNNGITIISDATYMNEQVGRPGTAQLQITNPQIINGGQTAYTLSKIYRDPLCSNYVFEGKELITKIITLNSKSPKDEAFQERMDLIKKISTASNLQTAVIGADRKSNNQNLIEIQAKFFDFSGHLFERKRGEFHDGIYAGYVNEDLVIERNLFVRLCMIAKGDLHAALKKKPFETQDLNLDDFNDAAYLTKVLCAYYCIKKLVTDNKMNTSVGLRLPLARAYLMINLSIVPPNLEDINEWVVNSLKETASKFTEIIEIEPENRSKYTRTVFNKKTKENRSVYNATRWMRSAEFSTQISKWVKENT